MAASGHPHGCVRVGGGRPSWGAEVLIPAALRTKSRSTLEHGRTIPAPRIRGGADRCLWGARGGVRPSTCYAFLSFFQPLQGDRNKPTGPHGPGGGAVPWVSVEEPLECRVPELRLKVRKGRNGVCGAPAARQGGRGSPHFFSGAQTLVPALEGRPGCEVTLRRTQVRSGWHCVPECPARAGACDRGASRLGSRPLLPARLFRAGGAVIWMEPKIAVPRDMSWAEAREEPFSQKSEQSTHTVAHAPQSPGKERCHLPPILPGWPGQVLGGHWTGGHDRAAVVTEEQAR